MTVKRRPKDGADGVGVTTVRTEYYLSTSSTTQTGGTWQTTVPAWVTGTYIWERIVTVKDNGAETVGTPYLSQTWENLNQLKADLIEEQAKTQYHIKIEGGLIYTALMKLFDAGATGDETAGISGIVSGDTSNPAFWAGGSYSQAIAGTAKAIIRHDGSVKFTDADITGTIHATSGDIGGFDIANGRIGVVQSGDNPTSSGLALYNDFIKFSNSQSTVFLGTNVLPATSGTTALARFESTYIDNLKKYGLIINISGAKSYFGGNNNVAIALEKGVIDRIRWQIRAKNASSGSHVFTDETEVVLYLSSSSYYVSLPAYPEVGEIKIVTRVNEYNLQVRGNGNEILDNISSAHSTSIFFGPGYTIKSRSLIFRWDGNYWIMNTWS